MLLVVQNQVAVTRRNNAGVIAWCCGNVSQPIIANAFIGVTAEDLARATDKAELWIRHAGGDYARTHAEHYLIQYASENMIYLHVDHVMAMSLADVADIWACEQEMINAVVAKIRQKTLEN